MASVRPVYLSTLLLIFFHNYLICAFSLMQILMLHWMFPCIVVEIEEMLNPRVVMGIFHSWF